MRTKALFDYFDPKKKRSCRLQEAHVAQPIEQLRINTAEKALAKRAAEKGGKCFRSGWPDFLLELPEKKTIAVEVKQGADNVSAVQAKMFSALERAGLKVFVWNPLIPDRLTPWRAYLRDGASKIKTDRDYGTEVVQNLQALPRPLKPPARRSP